MLEENRAEERGNTVMEAGKGRRGKPGGARGSRRKKRRKKEKGKGEEEKGERLLV